MKGIKVLAWFLFAFLCGSLPFSVWIGRDILKVDICQYGDKNPGEANVFQAGGRIWRAAALVLDFLKGAISVVLADFRGDLRNWGFALVALAPVLDHAYSPLPGFHGGKATATTIGIWTGLSFCIGPIVLGLDRSFRGARIFGLLAPNSSTDIRVCRWDSQCKAFDLEIPDALREKPVLRKSILGLIDKDDLQA